MKITKFVAALAVLALPVLASADMKAAATSTSIACDTTKGEFTGVVKSVDAKTNSAMVTVSCTDAKGTTASQDWTVQWSGDTKVMMAGDMKAETKATFNVGDKVTVNATKDADGNFDAMSINVWAKTPTKM